MSQGKQCARCERIRSEADFTKRSASPDGLHPYCRDCTRGLCREWHEENHEYRIAYTRKRYQENGAMVRASIKAWADAHPDIIRARNAANRARAAGVSGEHVSAAELRALWDQYDQRCAYCGASAELTLDHIVPISRGGSNDLENCVPACWPCNQSKNDRTFLEWRMGVRAAPRAVRAAAVEARAS